MCPHHLRCIANPAPHDIHRNVNHLVPIAAYKIGTMTISNYENRGFTPTTGFKPANGIGIDDDQLNGILEAPNEKNDQAKRILDATDNNHQQLNRILEATASLAVAEATLQVVAVALHIDKTRLTIAENCNVAPGLVKHIKELWGQLHELGPGDPTEEQKLKFFKPAYCYSVSKNLKRYNKWMPRLSLFLLAVSAVPTVPELGGFIVTLKEFVESLKVTHNFLQKMETEKIRTTDRTDHMHSFIDRKHLIEYTREEKWDSLMKQMDDVVKRYPRMLDDFAKYYPTKISSPPNKVYPALNWGEALAKLNDEFRLKIAQLDDQKLDDEKLLKTVNDQKLELQEWVESVKAHPDPGLLNHAFETLTTQHRHIIKLLSAPAKPFLSRLFIAPMEVTSVPGTENVSITLPMDELGLSRLIRAMYESVKPRITTNLITVEVDKLLPQLKKKVDGVVNGVVEGVVHCECALVAYLEDTKNQDEKISNYTDVSKQYNYIGVSKPSCGACNAWLTAFNETSGTGRTWYTSGCHGKWYKNWIIPPAFNIEALKDEMAKIVCEEFVRYCNPRVHENTRDDTGSKNPRTVTRL